MYRHSLLLIVCLIPMLQASTYAQPYDVSGAITVGGIGVSGVLVSAGGGYSGSGMTDGSGAYTITGVPVGATNIVLTPTKVGYVFNPTTHVVPGPVTGNVTGQDFTGALNPDVIAADDFNRPDETPFSEAGNWRRAVAGSAGTDNLMSDQVTGGSGEALYYWQGAGTFDNTRQFARARIVQAGGQAGLVLLGGIGQALVVSWGGGTLYVYWYSGGAYQGNLSTTSSTLQNGDVVEAILENGTVYVEINGSIVRSVANTTTLTSGTPGFETYLAGAILDDWEAGAPPQTRDISGTVTSGGTGLSGVLVSAGGGFSGSATTGGSGTYTITGIPDGSTSIVLTPTKVRYLFAPPTHLLPGPVTGNVTGEDFVGALNPDVIAADDFNRPDETPLSEAGNWGRAVAGSPPGTDNLTSNQVSGGTGEALYYWQGAGTFDNTKQFARMRVVQAGGQVGLVLLGNTGRALVVSWSGGTVYFYWYTGGAYQGNLTTAASTLHNGDIIEAVLSNGTVSAKVNGSIVKSVANTTTLTSGSPGFETYLGGAALDDWEAGTAETFAISGTITDGSNPLAGVTVTATGDYDQSVLTDSAGRYLVPGIPQASNVTVTPSKAGYTFVPVNRSYTSVSASQGAQNFTGTLNTYTIAATAAPHGTIAPSGVLTISYGGSQTFTATPDVGYSAHFTVDGVPLSPKGVRGGGSMGPVVQYTFTNVTTNHTIDASFTIDTYTLTVNATNGTVTKSPDQPSYTYGTSVTLTPAGAIGYHFVSWSGDVPAGHETDNPLTVMMDQNRTLAAAFAINVYTITSTAGPHGTVSPLGAVSVNYGGSQTFTATPDTGYSVHFTVDGGALAPRQVRKNGGGVDAVGNPGKDKGYEVKGGNPSMGPVVQYTFDNVTANRTIDATFTIDTLTLTVNATNGTVTKSPDQPSYTYGTSVTLTPAGAIGYHFVSWSGDVPAGHETDNPLTVMMDQNRTLAAAFAINVYTITSTAGPHGTVSPLGAVSVNYGGGQTFTATPDVGYSAHFTVDGVPLSPKGVRGGGAMGPVVQYTFTNVTANHTIDASFTIDTLTLTVNATNGTVTKSPDQPSYTYGTSVTLTPAGAIGYHFVSWSGDVPAGHETDNPLTVMMDQNRTLAAAFAINVYTITSTAGPHGTVSPLGGVSVNYGGGQTFTATPDVGYSAHFTVDGVPLSPKGVRGGGAMGPVVQYTFTNVTANHTIDASFTIDTLTLTVNATNGTVTKSPDQPSYTYGTSVTLTPSGATGYHFVSWSGDVPAGHETDNPLTVVMDQNRTVTATFAINTYTLTVNATNGTVTKSPDQPSYTYGTSVTLTPAGATGYHFVNWSGDVPAGHETDNPLTVVMDQNRTVTATFAVNVYTITSTAGPHGTVSPLGAVSVNYGGNQTFTATPDVGYSAHFTVDGVPLSPKGVRGHGAMGPVVQYTFTNVTANHTIDASFTIDTYTLTVNATNGTVTKSPDQPTYNYGASVTLTPSGATGYHFVSWSGDVPAGHETDNPLTVVMDQNRTLTATFAIDTYTLTVNATNGTVTKSPDQPSYTYGTSVTLTPAGAIGYHFVSWSGDVPAGHETDNPLIVVMDQNRTVTATFAINTYTLTVNATNGTVTKSPDQPSYTYGTSVTLTPAGATGYHFVNWSGDVPAGHETDNPLIVVIDQNRTVTATFAVNVYTITSTAGPHGTVSPLGAVSVNYGGNQTFTATPDVGYSAHFTVDGVPLSPKGVRGHGAMGPVVQYTFTNVTANHTIDASFTIDSLTLTVNATNGTVTKSPDQPSYTYGTSVTLTPSGATGYHFVSWSGDVPAGHETDNPLTVVMDQNRTVTATFAINTYTLTVNATNGTVTKSPDQPSYTYGTGVTLTPAGATGYHFVSWSGDVPAGHETDNPLTVVMDQNRTVTAAFAINRYRLNVVAIGNGTVSKSPDSTDYPQGFSVTVTAQSGSGWYFAGWKGDTTTTANPIVVVMNSTKNDTATFLPMSMVSVSLGVGWNMISNPVLVTDDTAHHLYPTSMLDYVYRFTPGGYATAITMENGVGYWGRFPASAVQSVVGLPSLRDSIPVAAGWNMVGTITNSVDTSTIVSIPPGLRGSSWYGYAGAYSVATQLVPGQAYWVKANSAGQFVFANPLMRPGAGVQANGATLADKFNTLTIADSRGRSQTIYFGPDGGGQVLHGLYDMPPLPPAGGFDARFENANGGTMVQTHPAKVSDAVEFPVTVQSDAYPLTITWNVCKGTASYELTDRTGGRMFLPTEMKGEGSMKITNAEAGGFSVKVSGDDQVPREFALAQNYPNPFNPSTRIAYDLPIDAHVSLRVFNIIGQEIATLVNEEQKAGQRLVEWDARTIASGVYFYRLEAGSFTSVKKLVLLR